MSPPSQPSPGAIVAVTGATGYVGGRLVPQLLAAGHRVRCLVREPRKLDARPWRNAAGVEVRRVELADPSATARALEGCAAAHYLVHSMIAQGRDYRQQDRELARSFANAAAAARVGRIVYLGGLGELGEDLSEHLTSRREVENELAATGVPFTVFRAAMIIGSGSASFEILRYLVEGACRRRGRQRWGRLTAVASGDRLGTARSGFRDAPMVWNGNLE